MAASQTAEVGANLRYETLVQLVVQLNQVPDMNRAALALVNGIKYVLQLSQWRLLKADRDEVILAAGSLREARVQVVARADLSPLERESLNNPLPRLLDEPALRELADSLPSQFAGGTVDQLYVLPNLYLSGEPDFLFLMGARGRPFNPLDLKFAGLVARLFADKLAQFRAEDRIRSAEREKDAANARLQETVRILAEKDERIQEDLLQACAFQQSILPRLPSTQELLFHAVFRPAERVGGDIYDVCEITPGRVRIFLADTPGHGVQASLRTMILKAEYDRLKRAAGDPAALLGDLNAALCGGYPNLELMCSACCVDLVLDGADGGRGLYANCAHVPVSRIARGEVTELYCEGPFLGLMPQISLAAQEFPLERGDRLLLYTDGLSEQHDSTGLEFGVRFAAEALRAAANLEDAVDAIMSRFLVFTGGGDPQDDMTLIAVEYRGAAQNS